MTPGSTLQPIVGGHWLTELCTWGDVQVVHGWPGDCLEASWSMTSRYKAHHPAFHRDALTYVTLSGLPVWGGLLQEPVWNGRDAQVTVRGFYRAAEDYPAFTSALLATDNPAVAMDAQIARGLPFKRTASIPNAALLDGSPDRGNTLAALLDAQAEQDGLEWGVDARGRAYMAGSTSHLTSWSTTGVDYHVVIGAADLSPAEDSFASHVILWYLNQVATYKAVSYPPYAASGPTLGNGYERRWGHHDWLRDITDLGNVADADAAALAQTIYERGILRPSFQTGLELFPGELLEAGGVRADFNRVRPNRVVRVHGPRDEVAHTPYIDFVIGKVTRKQGQPSILLDPVGVSAQSEDDVYQEVLEEAWARADA